MSTPTPKTALALIQERKDNILSQMPAFANKTQTFSLMLRLSRDNALKDCTPASVVQAIVDAASMGLSLTPNMGEAYILPQNDREKGKVARLEVGYKGFLSLAKRAGLKSVRAEIVRKGDEFTYSLGLNPSINHVVKSKFGDMLTHAYAIAIIDGHQVLRVLDEAEIIHTKKSSKSANSSYSPWTTHPEAMWRKTAIKRLLTSQSLSPELSVLVGYDTNNEVDRAAPVTDIGFEDVSTAQPEAEQVTVEDLGLS